MAKAKGIPNKNAIHVNREFKPRTLNQAAALRAMVENEITILHGVAGSGKSFLAIGLAVSHLMTDKIKKIIITRPTVEASPKGLGYTPGSIDEKMAPFCIPVFEMIKSFIEKTKFEYLVKNGSIEIATLEHMRGRNFEGCYVIADESQNCTLEQLKMLMTRLCDGSKIFIIGDTDQSDLGYSRFKSGLQTCIDILSGKVDGLAVCELGMEDIQRSKIIGEILTEFKNHGV